MNRNSWPDRGYLDLPSVYYPEHESDYPSSPVLTVAAAATEGPLSGPGFEQQHQSSKYKQHRSNLSTSSTASYTTSSSCVSPLTTTFPLQHRRIRSLGGYNNDADAQLDIFSDGEDDGARLELTVLSKWASSIWRRASETLEDANFPDKLRSLGLGKSEIQREEERWFGDLVDFEAARREHRRRSSAESFVEGVAFAGCAVLALGGIWWVFA